MRALRLVLLIGCGANIPPQPRPEPTELTLETAAACAKAKQFDLEIVTGTSWRVRAGSAEHAIDTRTATCDDVAIATAPGTPVIDLLSAAAKCVQGPPWNGEGESKSALDLQHPIVHRRDKISVEYSEAEPHSKPAGAEVWVDGCQPVPRE